MFLELAVARVLFVRFAVHHPGTTTYSLTTKPTRYSLIRKLHGISLASICCTTVFFPKSAGGSLKPTRYSFTESLRCISLPIRILPDGFFPKPMGGGLFMKCAKHRDNFGFVSEPDSFVIIIMNSCSMTILTCTPIQYFLMFCDLSNLEVRI